MRISFSNLFWRLFFTFWLAQIVMIVLTMLMVVIFYIELDHYDPEQHGELKPRIGSLLYKLAPEKFPAPDPEIQLVRPKPIIPLTSIALVAIIFSTLVAGYFTGAIKKIKNAFLSLAKGNLETHLQMPAWHKGDELNDIAGEFNAMVSRLRIQFNEQRELMHDISHELRSPLAKIQAAVDLLQQQPDRSKELLAKIQKYSRRTGLLLDEILTLGKIDSSQFEGVHQAIEIKNLVSNVIEYASVECEIKGCVIKFEYLGSENRDLLVLGNRELMFRAVDNLIRNAIYFSPENSDISIAIDNSADHVWICVVDSGPGLEKEIIENISNRFFKKSSEGYGLGLSIVAKIMDIHSGQIQLGNADHGGANIKLIFDLMKISG